MSKIKSIDMFLVLLLFCLLLMSSCGPSPEELEATSAAEIAAAATPEKHQSPEPTWTQIEPTPGQLLLVTSTEDSGPNTLRQALLDAQPGETIIFDPVVFPPTAPATISVTSELPHILINNITLDASNAGVILDGSLLSGEWDAGLKIGSAEGCKVMGLQIFQFSGPGIVISDGATYSFIGGDQAIGSGPLGQGNLISNNKHMGIVLQNTSFNTIEGNYIGTDLTGNDGQGNLYLGIYIEDGSNNRIINNLISDNGAGGIALNGSNTYSNEVSDNNIGVDSNQSLLVNQGSGVQIVDGAHNNQVGPGNIIANTNIFSIAVQVSGSDSIENTITQNRIYDSRWIGIDLWGGGNLELAPPVIIDFDLLTSSISGMAYPNALVEVFSIDNDNWSFFRDEVEADDDGYFEIKNSLSITGPHLTVSATDSDGNTSEFSLITDGDEGTTSLQPGNPEHPTRLETFKSNELEDNHIGSYWHNLWESVPLTTILDQTRYMGVKRFRFGIENKEIVNEIIDDHDEFLNSLEENGIQLTYGLTLYRTLYEEPISTEDLCLRFDTTREDYTKELDYFLEYVAFSVEHFKGRIQYYEIWNEPDNPACYLGINADDYITLVKETVKVIRNLQAEYPEELQDIKIKLGGIILRPGEEYLLHLLRSDDIMQEVDVISWHPFYGDSPDSYPEYYHGYPEIVQNIKDTASAHGFTGEYHAEEMNWRPHSDAEEGLSHPSQGEIAYAKYWARGILMNLGLDVMAGNLRIPHQFLLASNVVRNLSTIMAGHTTTSLDVEIEPLGDNIASYSFALPNGDILFALWTNDVAADHDPGDSMGLTFHDLSAERVVGIDVLHGFEQELEYEIFTDGDLVISDLVVKDYPIIIKFINPTK